jgi:hypothetical protein
LQKINEVSLSQEHDTKIEEEFKSSNVKEELKEVKVIEDVKQSVKSYKPQKFVKKKLDINEEQKSILEVQTKELKDFILNQNDYISDNITQNEGLKFFVE